VNVINKQKFLAELGKLLTFMYEEDRQLALAMYADMFEEAESETALMQTLMSPTKQAVLVARSYNAKVRNPKSNKKTGGDSAESGEAPEFVKLIESIRSTAFSAPAEDAAPAAAPVQPKPSIDLEAQLEAEDIALRKAEKAEEEHYFTHITELEEEPVEPEAAELAGLDEMTEDRSMSYSLGEDQETDEENGSEGSDAANTGEDKLNDFMAEYVSPVDHLDSPEDEEGIEVEFEDLGDSEDDTADVPGNSSVIDILNGKAGKAAEKYERKPRVFLLILYILAAIPIGLAGTVILLIPTLLFLALAAATIMVGVALISAAFSNFAVVADFLVVVGASIVVMAIGILFLWTFLWFIIGAIAGLIRGLCTLGGKWCYKEVKVNG